MHASRNDRVATEGDKMRNLKGLGTKVGLVSVAAALLALQALPANAAIKGFGARDCTASLPYVQTFTYSNGNTVHLQVYGTGMSKTFNNGANIVHRYYSSGYTQVTASSATTDGSFQSSGNGVTCTS